MQKNTAPSSTCKEERFWAKVDKSGACWQWAASKFPNGYGQFRVGTRMIGAHRVSYEIAYGPIAPGMVVDHICHNKSCVNPEHLRAVTNKQNMEHRTGAQQDSKSGVRGVSWCATNSSWRVDIRHRGERIFGGRYKDLADAEKAAIALRNKTFTHNDLDRVVA